MSEAGPGDREQQARALFASFGEGPEAVRAAIREQFAERCVWVNGSVLTTTGPDEAIAFIEDMERRGIVSAAFEIRHLTVRGDVVLAERVDHARAADGSLIWSLPIVGVLEYEGDELVAWREYFDLAALEQAGG